MRQARESGATGRETSLERSAIRTLTLRIADSDRVRTAVAYFGAVTLGVAEPIYTFTRSASTLMALDVPDVLALVFAVQAGSVAILLLVRLLAGRFGHAVDAMVFAGMILSLGRQAQMAYVPVRGVMGSASADLMLFGGIGLVLAGTVHAVRRHLGQFMVYLGVLSVVFPLRFAWAFPAQGRHAAPVGPGVQTSEVAPRNPAVFVLIFDELSLELLLNRAGGIDAEAFPHLARFSRESVWFRRGIANYLWSRHSVASLLTGEFSPRPLDDIAELPSSNLLSILAVNRYRVAFYSRVFGCSADSIECVSYYDGTLPTILTRIVAETGKVYVPNFLRTAATPWLPAYPLVVEAQMLARLGNGDRAQPGRASVYHLMVSHWPYVLALDGHVVRSWDSEFRGGADVKRTLHRYRSQVQYLDRQFGAFVQGLKDSGHWDRSVVVVTSDHGTCWAPGCMGRLEVDAIEPSLVRIPMMIRAPNLSPAVIGRDYQHIDFLPTVLDVLGISGSSAGPGRSALADDLNGRPRLFFIDEHRSVELDLPVARVELDRPARAIANAPPSGG